MTPDNLRATAEAPVLSQINRQRIYVSFRGYLRY